MYLSPLKYCIEFSGAILFRGAKLDALWPQVMAMAGIGGALFTFATLRFRARFGVTGS
jgi:ABC-2 type transport system permease protein